MMSDLTARWDALINRSLIADPLADYILVSGLRVLVAYSIWRMLVALWRYANAALPPPHSLVNLSYWLRWWVWLRLRDHRGLKLSSLALAVVFLVQIPAGVAGSRNDFSPAFLVACAAWIGFMVSLAREFHRLIQQIQQPAQP